jgi:uncharacterized protein YkwD
MRRTSGFMACFAALVALLCPSVASASAEAEAIETLNKVRQGNGVAPLRTSRSLSASAARYARQMLARDYFGHLARIAVGARFRSAGETLAMHSGSRPAPRRTIGQWMASPPHRAVLLSGSFRMVGMGMARGDFAGRQATLWVAHVGAY